MNEDLELLTNLLRVELTAVHQQFFHMLALKQWKEEDALRRVTKIDTEDFRNAMQIIDLLVSNGQAISLGSHRFFPGSDLASVLSAEKRIEERLKKTLSEIEVSGSDAIARVNRATKPRHDYGLWLQSQIHRLETKGTSAEIPQELSEFVAAIIALVEQPMLHAFLAWHNDRLDEADNFWRISGAAMLYGTALIKRGAVDGCLPTPSCIPAVEMKSDLGEAFLSDCNLVRECSELGRAAAGAVGDGAVQRICVRIAEDCDKIGGMTIDGQFPASFGYSKAFDSFSVTRDRHLL